ncbi:hypothetical protein BP6252_08991 [Coleophoma cylindrospora]|uniref:Calcium-dependent phosphotriesterase n=1 Tax=Coleophoma cylindrospora TaxID=1849047 RepID=A0A3D8R0Q4_9HELO|nr:hypothetical protein BP6252_08991 [Coleophoma cylindrospora]
MAISSGTKVAAVLTAVIAALGAFVYNLVSVDIVALKSLPEAWHGFPPGAAEIIFQDELKYCEDALFDHEMGVAILSCDPGRGEWNTVMGTMYNPNPKGALYLYNYVTKTDLRQVELVGLPEASDFHPLGINFYREPGKETRLFVVNHQRNGSTVDVFTLDYENSKAAFMTSISDGDQNILAPNAVAPISYTSFYVTNDHYFIPRLNPILNKIETFGSLPLGWVTLVDITGPTPKFTTATSNIGFANGIVLTPTGKEVIVASTISKPPSVFIYTRDSATNTLTFNSSVAVPFRPDNLSFDDGLDVNDKTAFDDEGRFLRGLVAAGHPAPLKLFAVSRDPVHKKAPSWVVEIRRSSESDKAAWSATEVVGSADGEFSLRTLYQSNGSHFSTSSTGAVDFSRGKMLVSGLYEKGLLEFGWNV